MAINYLSGNDAAEAFADLVREARRVLVFTGAGMSTESGVPDFRSARGLYGDASIELLASREGFERRFDEWLAFYRGRIAQLQEIQPNDGHRVIARLQASGKVGTVITQNVDGLHVRAGATEVVELHGRIYECHCEGCGAVIPSERYLDDAHLRCACGGKNRPSVVLFGESLPEGAIQRALLGALTSDLVVVLGSSLQVAPANMVPQVAQENGARLVIVNHDPTPFDEDADLVIRDGIGATLAAMERKLPLAGAT